MSILRSINIYAGGVTGTWTAPLNLLNGSVLVECIGGGGAGARTPNTSYRGGAGGGGGSYARAIVSVVAGSNYTIHVGLGGYYVSTSENTHGEDTTFTAGGEVVCRGRGASSATIGSYIATAGATFATADGDSGFSGGAGGDTRNINFCSSGGGGAAGGPLGVGAAGTLGTPNATNTPGGAAAGGGAGLSGKGANGFYSSGDAVPGNFGYCFGGGGAGGYRKTSSVNGGPGGGGVMRLTWEEAEESTQIHGMELDSLVMEDLTSHPAKEGFYIVNGVLYYQYPIGTIYTVDVTAEE